jgi:anaerobic ribonucleoside-triphosphate reductase activating protein
MNPTHTPALRLNNLTYPLSPGINGAMGNGVQATLQGCSHPKCPGCTSPHTHDPLGGRMVSVAQLLNWMKSLPQVGRLTVSGGEPTDQADGLRHLLQGFRAAFPNAEVVLYSALLWHRLQASHAALIALCDVVVAGPYVHHLPPTPLAGSNNQKVMLLTPLAKRIYAEWQDWPMHRVQVGSTPNASKVLMVGIPSRAMTAANAREAADTVTSKL